jgi:hypothetical protein
MSFKEAMLSKKVQIEKTPQYLTVGQVAVILPVMWTERTVKKKVWRGGVPTEKEREAKEYLFEATIGGKKGIIAVNTFEFKAIAEKFEANGFSKSVEFTKEAYEPEQPTKRRY